MLPNPFDDQPSRIKTKTAITYAILITANVAAWTWALIAFVDRPILVCTENLNSDVVVMKTAKDRA
jgi:high-affinity nickel-transport protein